MVTKCGNCRNEIDIDAATIKERKIANTLSELYTECPLCKEELSIIYINENIKHLMKLANNATGIKKRYYARRLQEEVDRFNHVGKYKR